jgi:hypothetical protein
MKKSGYQIYMFFYDSKTILAEGIVVEESKKSAAKMVQIRMNELLQPEGKLKLHEIGLVTKDHMDQNPFIGWGIPGILFLNYTIPSKPKD